MKTAAIILGALLYINLQVKSQPTNTDRDKLLKSKFDLFFSLNEGDTLEAAVKIKTGLEMINICKDNSYTSKYCTYASLWAAMASSDDMDHVEKSLEELESKNAGWAELHFLKAQYLSKKKEAGYIEEAQKCIELNPALIQPYYFLATEYYELKNYRLSLRYYDLLEKVGPNHRSLYYNRANVKTELKDLEGAIADYTKAIQREPRDFKSWFNRGRIYLQAKEYAKAEKDFDAFIKLYPSYSSGYYYRGAAKYYQGNQAGACEDMKTAAQMGNEEAKNYVTNSCK